jgi:cytoskeleton protein RodZ
VPAAIANEAESAGARLARARARLGLSVDEVAEQLKLDPYTVVALEAGDHRSIGATVFVRGFLRRYATLVGEPPADIEALYSSLPHAGLQPDLSKTGMHRIEPARFQPKIRAVPALIAAAGLVIAGASWWALRSKQQAAATIASAPATPVTAVPMDAVPADAAAGTAAGGAAVPGNDETSPPVTTLRRRVRLTFTGDCWAEVYDARGMRLFFGFGHAGTSQELNGAPPFRVVLGNVEAVSLSLEGASVSLPATAPGEKLRISLAANGAVTARR